jgi:putative peptidoglycan lipid II flippase
MNILIHSKIEDAPKVSVIIPCYKDAGTLSGAIHSVQNQTYKNIEIIVVNDASPESLEIEQVIEEHHSITYTKNPVNVGLAASRNIGLKKARGEYVAFLDADDQYHPKKIELQLRHINNDCAVACDVEIYIDRVPVTFDFEELNQKFINTIDGILKISFFNYLTGASILVRRDILLNLGGYDERLRSCEDYDLWLRLLKAGIKVVHIKLPLYFYRFNSDGLSKNIDAISYWELEVIMKNISTQKITWLNRFFVFCIWILWLTRHLIRAEQNNNLRLKAETLNRAKESRISFGVSSIISVVNFFRFPGLYLKLRNFLRKFQLEEFNLSDARLSEKIELPTNGVNPSPFLSNNLIWFIFFVYSLATALLFQILLPILLPSLHAGNGLMSQDSMYFHQSAIALAEEIRHNGWGAWGIWPNPYATGNVAVLGAVYALFGYKPILLLPLNAFLHACSGLCLMLIGRQLFSGNHAKYGSLVAGCLYIIFPSSLNWYAQNHKDEYAALGFFLLVLAGIRLLKAKEWKGFLPTFFLTLTGLMLTIFVRPNNLQLFVFLGTGIVVFGALNAIKSKAKFAPVVVYAALIFASTAFIKVSPHQETSAPQNIAGDFAKSWKWIDTPEIPKIVDNTFAKLANIRVFMAANALKGGAGSMLDVERMPSDFYSVIEYFPAAGLNGLLAPYPSSWAINKSFLWMIGVIEIAICYLIFPGALWLLWWNRENLGLWWILLATYAVLTIEAFLISNLGTLHRIRYPFIFIFILFGCIGWSSFLAFCFPKKFIKKVPAFLGFQLLPLTSLIGWMTKSTYRAIPLVFITGLLFLGLFARDLLFAHTFGFGTILDSYQFAANLPLATTTLLAVPLCSALIMHFERLRTSNPLLAVQWVQGMSGRLLLWFFIIGLLLILVQCSSLIEGSLQYSTFLYICFFPVVLLSGVTILGNAVLICNNLATHATSFQLAVPILTIFLTYYFGEPQLGVIAPIAGLVFGQILNLILVSYFCHKCGFPLIPRFVPINWSQWGQTYMSLVISATASALSIPVALYFSSRLMVGSISTFYMGAKVFQSISVFIGAIYLSLVLPYFIRLINHAQREFADKIFENSLLLGVYIAVFTSMLVCLFAPEIISFLFLGKKIGIEQVSALILVVQIGIVQLPFFVASLTIIKYLLALGDVKVILYAALAGQIINAYLSWTISHQGLGVEMLSIAVFFGLFFNTLILIFWVKAKVIISWIGICSLFLTLLLFATMILSVLLSNYLALLFSIILFISLPLFFMAMSHRDSRRLRYI